VFKESDNDFANSEFSFSVCVVEIAFVENVVEGEDRNHLFVKSNFDNTIKDVKFNFDDSSSVLHVRNVVERIVVGQQLIIFDFSRKIKRRHIIKVDYSSVLSVDSGRFKVMAGQKSRDNVKGFAVVIADFLAKVGHVVIHLKAHKFIDGVENVVELVFTGFSVFFSNFAG